MTIDSGNSSEDLGHANVSKPNVEVPLPIERRDAIGDVPDHEEEFSLLPPIKKSDKITV